ncbi:MAG TPA: hypothetical protein VGJ80_04065 [Gemmatimonadales bacterium]
MLRTTRSSPRWRSRALLKAGLLLGAAAALVRMTCGLAFSGPSGPNVVFESDWSTDTGTSRRAVTDGGRWKNYWEFNNGAAVQLLSVVPGGPGGRNALKVVQGGERLAADLQQNKVVPPSTDFYVRFYMRNDDTSASADHIVVSGIDEYWNLTYMRKSSGTRGWTFVISLYGCDSDYPLQHLGPDVTLSRGVWYRFEYFVDFVDPTHVQVHPRVYDARGTLILKDADFRQSGYGSAVWNGRSDWTLASLYSVGHRFCVKPGPMTSFGMGNNGQKGAIDTRLPWYFAGLQIRTDWWPGP